ncbi:DUF3782 domain-containing protein [Candidatus Methanodesulfokora washburnensis]|uniref:DUF3782 domain-containing protein n=1 Tax=Candidatus Methanodesulfokora washburnensis TaxID=2478471 RepID=A0A3R9PHH5_9CREN|nr:DUF3782 domain-containing protein [Candidatus Methanodesulfokores washburnensis]RSN73691.1 DUF3782 domain-containing protein [Candidatus Methanodesulfokores washburnensis]
MTTKKEFLRLLEEDNEFRLAVAGFLGYGEILKSLEKHDRKFVMILKRLREHDKKFTEVLTRLEEHDRKFTEVLTRLEEHDKKFSEILNEIKQLREDFKRLSMRVEVTIESMGRRWGEDLERMVLEIFKEALEKGE